MFKKVISFFTITSIVIALVGCSSKRVNIDKSKIQVAVSFNAMREFTEAIGGSKVQITTLVPEGTEPHDFELKARDMEALSDAKVFVYNGFGMETWVDEALQVVDNKALTVVEASKGFKPIKNSDSSDSQENSQYDPHFWLSLKGAENAAKNIKDALIKVDKSNKSYYEKNYNNFYNELEQLFNDYNKKFSTLSNKNFVTGHAAFAYLCRDFALKQNSVEDVFAEGEPSARGLKELVDYCNKERIKTIFVEDMVSPKVSGTLAEEVGAKTEKIYTIESKEDGKNYIQSMEANLEEIYTSLK